MTGFRLTIHAPLKLVSEANAHTHWRVRQRRAKAQRAAVGFALLAERRNIPKLPARVVITRIAPRALDSDNLVGSAKHVRDEVATALGVDDRDARVEWVVRQERGEPKEYGVRIEIEAVEHVRRAGEGMGA